jgi:sugar phosphate isomerase/epimerase
MARPVILFSGSFADQPLADLVPRLAEWGYQGLELSCWGDHFEVQRALGEEDYCESKLALLNRHELTVPVLAAHRVSQAISDVIDSRHQGLLPDYVWGDGQPAGVQERAAEELLATFRAAQKLGVSVVSGFTGSPIWSYVVGYPAPTPLLVADTLRDFAARWDSLLDVCQECGLNYAFEVHPGQIAFDLYSAEMVLDALNGREQFGFTFDPSHLHWQGVDPVEFLRRFRDRIYHVHVKDVAMTLNGRSGLLGSYLPQGDHRRGWEYRAPGHGGIDWEGIIRALNEIGYEGPLAVEWKDPSMSRESGVEEALRFVQRLDFEPAPRPESQAFR